MLFKLIPLVPIMTFSSSAYGLLTGAFDETGFPAEVIPLHAWVNAFEALGWACVLVLSFIGKSLIASRIAVFLAGMWFWDMVTTLNLDMPVPPLQLVWGPISVFVMLLLAFELYRDGTNTMKEI